MCSEGNEVTASASTSSLAAWRTSAKDSRSLKRMDRLLYSVLVAFLLLYSTTWRPAPQGQHGSRRQATCRKLFSYTVVALI